MPRYSKYRVPDLPENSPAVQLVPPKAPRHVWLKARQAGVGGSEIGALIGVNEHMTPFHVFRNKVEPPVEIKDNPYIQAGHDYEETVGMITARKAGLIKRSGGGLWRHRDHDFAMATPDFFATMPRSWKAVALIECKTAGDSDKWEGDDAPLTYVAQCQWQMGITGLKKAFLGCQVFDQERTFHLREIDFDKEWFEEMLHVAETFMVKHVLAWDPPMLDFEHPKTTELMKELYPKVIKPATELDEDAFEWVREHEERRKVFKDAEARLEEAKNWLRFEVAEAGAGYYGEHKVVSHSEVGSSSVDVAKLKEKYPDVYEDCTRRSTYRRLTVNIPKKLREKLENEGD